MSMPPVWKRSFFVAVHCLASQRSCFLMCLEEMSFSPKAGGSHCSLFGDDLMYTATRDTARLSCAQPYKCKHASWGWPPWFRPHFFQAHVIMCEWAQKLGAVAVRFGCYEHRACSAPVGMGFPGRNCNQRLFCVPATSSQLLVCVLGVSLRIIPYLGKHRARHFWHAVQPAAGAEAGLRNGS